MLVAARAIQGLGAAILLPLTLTLLSEAVPPEKRGMALGIWSSVLGLGIALGPFVGGAVLEGLAWQWIFWLNVPIGVILLPLAARHLSESRGPYSQLDLPGLALAGVGLLGITFGLVRSHALGWTSGTVVASLALGIALLCAFVAWERRTSTPMLPMRFFRSRAFSATNGVAFLMFCGAFGSIFLSSQFFQAAQGHWAAQGGANDAAVDRCADARRLIAGALSDRGADRSLLFVGLSMQAIAIFWMSQVMTQDVAYSSLIAPFAIAGVGIGIIFAPLANAVFNAVHPEEAGQASGAHNAIREFGTALGVAVLASIFASNGSYASPEAFADGMVAALPIGAALLGGGATRRAARAGVPVPLGRAGDGAGDRGGRPGGDRRSGQLTSCAKRSAAMLAPDRTTPTRCPATGIPPASSAARALAPLGSATSLQRSKSQRIAATISSSETVRRRRRARR